jgi:hypothetical protein
MVFSFLNKWGKLFPGEELVGSQESSENRLFSGSSNASGLASPTLGKIKGVVKMDCNLGAIRVRGKEGWENGNHAIDSPFVFVYF